ncbi:MAG: SPOR domain-containing protein [Pseudomonadales bacterium]|nr:SPOR domain-containing protein [Pseudomonadales bacterium]
MGDNNQHQLPAIAWLFTGVVTGLFLAFLYYLAGVQVPQEGADNQQAVEQAPNPNAPRFDFYTVLSDSEAMVKKSNQANSSNTSSDTKLSNQYMIQTGSFQNMQDADRRRAELLLLGLEVKTEKVEVRPGQVFHRVQVGPFDQSDTLQQAKTILNENRIEHIVLTLK